MSYLSRDKNNCIKCILESNLDLFQKLLPCQFYCQHCNFFKTGNTYCKINKPLFYINIIFMGFLVVPAATYYIYLPETCQTDKPSCLIFLGDLIFTYSSIILIYNLYTKMKIQEIEFNFWARLSERRRFFGLKNLISESEYRKLNFHRNFFLIVNFISSNASMFLYYFLPYDNQPWSSFRILVLLICYDVQFFIGVNLVIKTHMIGAVMKTFQQSLETSMSKHQTAFLEKNLKSYTRLILAVNRGINLLMKYMSLILAFSLGILTASLILNLYILIQFDEFNVYVLFLVEFRTITSIVRLGILLGTAEKCLNKRVSVF